MLRTLLLIFTKKQSGNLRQHLPVVLTCNNEDSTCSQHPVKCRTRKITLSPREKQPINGAMPTTVADGVASTSMASI
jgi:hypothetical protein